MKKFNEFVSLSERPLTKGEEDKKEDIVKGMKKDKKGFEDRYGDDAKSVMYATATKLAKEDVTLQDANGNDFLEVVDLIKPDPIKGVATEQKELEPTVDQEPSRKEQEDQKADKKNSKQLKQKEKKVNMMKRMVLMKKVQAVRAGAGSDIVAHNELEGEMVEGMISMIKKGAKRHSKAIEKKKIKNRKAVPYAALGASYEPEGEVIEAAGCETKKIENKGKKKIDPNKNPVVEEKGKNKENFTPHKMIDPSTKKEYMADTYEQHKKYQKMGYVHEAKVDQGRSDYGKATIRNWRRSGPSTVEPAMFDPENKRGKTIEKRREEHKARRGVKGAKVPTYTKEEIIDEEGYDRMRDDRLVKYGIGHDGSDRKGSTRYHSRPDTPEQKKRKQAASDQAYKSVVDKLKKRYGDGVMTSSRKIRKGKEVK